MDPTQRPRWTARGTQCLSQGLPSRAVGAQPAPTEPPSRSHPYTGLGEAALILGRLFLLSATPSRPAVPAAPRLTSLVCHGSCVWEEGGGQGVFCFVSLLCCPCIACIDGRHGTGKGHMPGTGCGSSVWCQVPRGCQWGSARNRWPRTGGCWASPELVSPGATGPLGLGSGLLALRCKGLEPALLALSVPNSGLGVVGHGLG